MSSPAAAALAAPQLSLSLVGVPNCGKTALFNRLTGSRQKVANYPGVTVERKEGRLTGPRTGRSFRVVDLPGAYSLEPATLDEAIARDVVLGRHATEPAPDLLVCVVDATNLRLNLRLVLELKRLGRPMIVALNMSDLAAQRGYTLDRAALERSLGVPVVPTVAVRAGGERALIEALDSYRFPPATLDGTAALGVEPSPAASAADIEATQREVRRVLNEAGYRVPARLRMLSRLDAVVLNPVAGPALLASFACAIPGIMAARTIPSSRDRLATIMIAPLMTCSARLPVYALLIGAFIPQRAVGIFNLRGLVLFALYLAGVASALLVAFVLKRTVMRGEYRPLLLELPEYRWPHLENLALGLWERTRIFLTRVGTIILSLMVVLWFLASFPAPPAGATGPAIQYSVAGFLGRGLEYLFAPIGFNWQISIALVPGLAAREVAVSALGTVYAMSGAKDVAGALAPVIAQGWSIATGLSLLAWYVFAPQCLSTLAVVKRETNSWRYPLYMAAYLFALAYLGAFVTYRVALMLGGGAS